MTRKGLWNEKKISTMKKTKTLQMNEDDEGTPIGDRTTQFKWIPQKSVGSAEVGTSNSNLKDAGVELEKLKRRLQALE